MAGRDYKQCAPGEYYHVYNRGNAKEDIFRCTDDYQFFIRRLRQNLFPDRDTNDRIKQLPPESFDLVSYSMMPNHFHLLMRQNADIPVSKLLSKVCTSYSKYFNKRHERIGHVFQDQFKQAHVTTNRYLVWVSAYIHQNAKVAGLVGCPKDYQWSSYREFLDGEFPGICKSAIVLDQFKNREEYSNFVDESYAIIQEHKDAERELYID